MIIVITAGGPADELPDLSSYEGASYIGVDAGVMTLLGMGIEPVEAVGDFDSVTDSEYENPLGISVTRTVAGGKR